MGLTLGPVVMTVRFPLNRAAALVAGLSAFVMSSTSGYAVSNQVIEACQGDYLHHCSAYALGSESLRQCMRNVGEGLSAPCIAALVQGGEVTKADIERYNARRTEGSKASNAQKATAKQEVTGVANRKSPDRVAKEGTGKAAKSGNTSTTAKIASADKAEHAGKAAKERRPSKIDKNDDNAPKAGKNDNRRKAVKVASGERTASRSQAIKISMTGKQQSN